MSVALRNVDVDLSADPGTWPFEAIQTVLERGLVADWAPLVREIRAHPWGSTARRVGRAAALVDDTRVRTLFEVVTHRAQERQEDAERQEVARRVRAAIAASGHTQAQFAEAIGTSASRLSTYASGKVMPSAALLVRMEGIRATTPQF